MNIWICAVAKMEELYIREWIEWHKQLGVDHIVIGDNNDSDYDKPLCPIVQDYIDSGFIEVININDELDVQTYFYNKIFYDNKDKYDWIGFIDIDEFIELPAYNNDIHLFLSDNKFKDIDSIIFPWLCYGDDGHLYYENKPVKERFKNAKYCLDDTNKIAGIKFFIKSISLYKVYKIRSRHNPERCAKDNYKIICSDSLGNIDFKRYNENNNRYTDIIVDNENYYNEAYISHYITKSTEEYIKYKMIRGRSPQQYGIRYTDEFYFTFNELTKEKQKMFEQYNIKIENARKKNLDKFKNSDKYKNLMK